MDIFKEQLIKRRPNIQTTLSKIAIISGAIALAAAVMLVEFILIFAPFIWAGIVIAVVLILKRFSVEFEYALTNHDLDIDIIVAKSRRKKRLSCNVRDFEAFRPVGSTELEHAFSSAHEVKDFSSGAGERHEKNTCFFRANAVK